MRTSIIVEEPVATRRVAIITLGCGRNEVDSEQLAGLFHREGTEVVDDPSVADVVLVNTCTFIAPAKQESVDTVLEACQLKDDAVARAVVIVGCMAQRYPRELADAIPEADAIVGFDGYPRLPAIIDDVLAGVVTDRVIGVGAPDPGSRPARGSLPMMVTPTPTPAATGPSVGGPGAGASSRGVVPGESAFATSDPRRVLALDVWERPRTDVAPATVQDALDRTPASGPRFPVRQLGTTPGERSWAYLKIASGCDRVCTFCAIPSFRGRFRSRDLDEVLAEAGWLADQGVRELVLVSENTTSWGKDLPGGRDLQAELLHRLAGVDGVDRIRLMYLQPAELTEPLLQAISSEPKVASYFDLSLQHVSGPVVSRMARSGDAQRFGELIARARSAAPDAVFRSNFILGFPGETEHDVDVLEAFLDRYELDWVGLFPFSSEDGTSSATMPDQVPDEVVAQRLHRVSERQELVADIAARRFVGRELDVLIDEVQDDDGVRQSVGRSYREAPDTDGEILLTFDAKPVEIPVGRMVRARVVEAVGVDLVAEVCTGPRDPAGV